MANTDNVEIRCSVPGCQKVIPTEEAADHHCSGCGGYICDDHFGDPWGSHNAEDHDDRDG